MWKLTYIVLKNCVCYEFCLKNPAAIFISVYKCRYTQIKQKSESACFHFASSSGYTHSERNFSHKQSISLHICAAQKTQLASVPSNDNTHEQILMLVCGSVGGIGWPSGRRERERNDSWRARKELLSATRSPIHSSRTEQQTKLWQQHRRAHCLALPVSTKRTLLAKLLISMRPHSHLITF